MAVESSPHSESRRGESKRTRPGRGRAKEPGSAKSDRPRLRIGSILPYALAVLLLIAYFVWMCIEMSTEAPGGGAVPLSIFGAVLLGVLAGGLSMLKSRRRDD